ncbi:hypothetical protein ACHAXM_002409, partial [Skeletonema potamos]
MMPTNKRSKPSSDPSYTTAKQNTSLVPTAVNTTMDTEELDLHHMAEDTKLNQKKKVIQLKLQLAQKQATIDELSHKYNALLLQKSGQDD